jgi:prepilin-type processing-associated H-X9-DG protein
MEYTLVKNSTGQIISTGFNAEHGAILDQNPDCTIYQGRYRDDEFYYNNGFTERPFMNLSISSNQIDEGKTLIISGIPEGANVTYVDGSAIVTDGSIDWSSDIAGKYLFYIEKFPYRDEVIEIEVI